MFNGWKILATSCFIAALPGSALADHAWSNYHWARTTSSFNLTIINSTTEEWDSHVTGAISDWSTSVMIMLEDPSGSTNSRVRRKCNAPTGTVRICNLAYGQNGWLGIAGISIDTGGHIIKGYTKLNDSYFSMAFYNNSPWKKSVTCQELGHNVGLGHQDEDFNNESLVSCMDYQNPPYESPNSHDYFQLEQIYDHIDLYNSYAGGDSGASGGGDGGSGCNAPKGKGCNKARPTNNSDIGWGVSIGRRGNSETFLRIDPDGTRHLTHVRWVDENVTHDEH